ncbi:MAG: hypothetical protein OSA98_05825 [Rubripirellula sp.]|jgi:hypothetical protein|nr:hypothetical protein [Rubripirellula sp.]
MNFLSHAIPYLDNPLLAVSTGIPDWLTMVDRKIRARGKLAEQHVLSKDTELSLVAKGIVKHIADDRWFHGTQAFVETNMELAMQLRHLLPGDAGFRPTFVGHILIEMLLDGMWIRDDRSTAEHYYTAIRQAPPATIQRCVNVITGKPTTKLVAVIDRFAEIEFLYDYLDHEKLLMRLNQVMKRVGLPLLPDEVGTWLPQAQDLVESRRRRLLTPPGDVNHFPLIPVT